VEWRQFTRAQQHLAILFSAGLPHGRDSFRLAGVKGLSHVAALAVLSVGAWWVPAGATAGPAVFVSPRAAPPGAVAAVAVNLANVVKLQFDLTYAPDWLTSGTPTGGGALADQVILTGQPSPGVRRVQLVSLSNSPMTSGVLVFIPFSIATNAPDQDVALTLTNVSLYNAQNQQITPAGLTNGVLKIEVPPRFISIVRSSTHGAYLELSASTNRSYILQCAPDPLGGAWVILSTNQSVTGVISLDDPEIPAHARRFYRAEVAP
jgi:hypothetical protein